MRKLLYLGSCACAMVVLQLIVKKTKMGKVTGAVSVDSDAAELMGINVNNTISFTFALGITSRQQVSLLVFTITHRTLYGCTPGISLVAAVLGNVVLSPAQHLVDLLSVFGDIINCNWFVMPMPSFMVS